MITFSVIIKFYKKCYYDGINMHIDGIECNIINYF